jgi:Uma2 family endonuclease
MSTVLRIGPHDHGREMTYEQFLAGDYEEGYKYELIDGSLYVSPQPNFPHDWVETHVRSLLTVYWLSHRNVISWVSAKARVFVRRRRKSTCPEPDISVYQGARPAKDSQWEQMSPTIVVEIVSESDPHKDYQRNVELYRQVPSILEYWLFDKCGDDDGPVMRAYSRDSGDSDWTTRDYGPADVYTTPLLPGFSLPVSPESDDS